MFQNFDMIDYQLDASNSLFGKNYSKINVRSLQIW